MPDRRPGDTRLFVYLTREPGSLRPCADRVLNSQGRSAPSACQLEHRLKKYGERDHKLALFCCGTGPVEYGKIPTQLTPIDPEDLLNEIGEYRGFVLEHLHDQRYGMRCVGDRFAAGEFTARARPADVPSYA